ncbi:SDR family oxidoreductase [uncultured Desulfovibrio sp.]|uniref:SDR family NAD(P)-dependent oxidoreductase n=1 Tax=uncultured Desulfovibrio sp. TaxID=167968 RepID=UPI00039F8258|nr:SDR family oxidoreductase [uncultured Desulfovibrio sp.]
MKISGSVALVTGGCGGLGRAIADMLAERDACVVVADCNPKALAELPEGFGRALLDVTDPEQARRVAVDVAEEYGAIHLLVNCAGRIVSAPFMNIMSPDQMMLSYDSFREDVKINLDSVFIVSAAVAEQMVRRRTRGCIVNISSISARGNEGQTSYAAAKAGVNAMTVTWSKELGRLGIRCNAVAPGFIGTPSTYAALQDVHIRHIVGSTPLRRLGETHEVAQAVCALAENDFINGVVLDVNGGLSF